MARICLSLTGRTIAEDLAVLDLYRGQIDLVELRADFLEMGEMLNLRAFPQRAGLPCILTVRRRVDGGDFDEGEGVRLVMMAKGLTHARSDTSANFTYVDLESDFRVSAIEEACRIFGTRIIRSQHFLEGLPENLDAVWEEIAAEPEEIPQLAATCRDAKEFARLATWANTLPPREKIIIGMGPYGFPSRILAEQLGSSLVFTSAISAGLVGAGPGHLDPEVLIDTFRFRKIGPTTSVFALGGGASCLGSRQPALHNAAFSRAGIDAIVLPVPAEDAEGLLAAITAANVIGAAITVPHKESILPLLTTISPEARDVGAVNTLARLPEGGWSGHNTDTIGFERSIREFLGRTDLRGLRVTLIGAGGAARAVALVLSRLGASGLVLNRTLTKARVLARHHDFSWAYNDERALDLVLDHSDLIVNATSVGMMGEESGDPLDWYEFTGREAVFDIINIPDRTPFLARAKEAGCRICNGLGMLRHQSAEQFRIWTGREPPSDYFE
ncbi:MAG TPA: type I 3-dehydroquinate dehydratase [Rectinemataceae bacterium]|nr:type I 3-dehydroquinate dehydratase [Rectinemataceae bacterium]